MSAIAQNYFKILDTMDRSANQSGRKLADVALIAISKRQPLEKISAYLNAGGKILGENYPEEGAGKKEMLPGFDTSWHMVGHVQSRKASLVAQYYDYIQTLDSLKLARRLQDQLRFRQKSLPFLIEINIGAEVNKSGYLIKSDTDRAALWFDLESILSLSNLIWRGIMIMPPISLDPEESRRYFVQGRECLDELQRRYPDQKLDQISMGTSLDYQIAIQEGATMVRIGTALFGKRN